MKIDQKSGFSTHFGPVLSVKLDANQLLRAARVAAEGQHERTQLSHMAKATKLNIPNSLDLDEAEAVTPMASEQRGGSLTSQQVWARWPGLKGEMSVNLHGVFRDFNGFSMVFSCFPRGFKGFRWIFHGFRWIFHGFSYALCS